MYEALASLDLVNIGRAEYYRQQALIYMSLFLKEHNDRKIKSIISEKGDERKLKQGKRPTRAQKQLIVKHGLDPEDWMVRMEDDRYVHLIGKTLGIKEIKILDKKSPAPASKQD